MIGIGFIVGIVGSLHCAGMCGPIAFALPVKDGNRVAGILLYNIGRIITYSLLGAVFGFLGQSFVLVGLQQYLSVFAGISLLLFLLLPTLGNYSYGPLKIFNKLNMFVRKNFTSLMSSDNFLNLFFIGILNGLLPCGMIYVALAGAVATGSVVSGIMYMALFGAGTIPVMFTITWFRTLLKGEWRRQLQRALPVFIAVMAIALILRGLSLGIPYVSPDLSSSKPSCCSNSSAIKCH